VIKRASAIDVAVRRARRESIHVRGELTERAAFKEALATQPASGSKSKADRFRCGTASASRLDTAIRRGAHVSAQAKRLAIAIWDWFHGFAAWVSVPIAVAQAQESAQAQVWSGASLAFAIAGATSLGFLPLFTFLIKAADESGRLPEGQGDVSLLTALRGGAEECLFRGLLLPVLGLGPQAVAFAAAHAFDFSDPGLKVARALQCLLRGLAYGALALRFGPLPVALGVAIFDASAFATVEWLVKEVES
jgi:hypothetical protein